MGCDEYQNCIEVKNLTKVYGYKKAIDNLNFRVSKGSIVGFLGPNGAGKSTTMRILSGLMPATSGSAWINGISVALDPLKIKKQLAFMPENNPLPEDMRVEEYLQYRASLKEIPAKKRKQRIGEVMELCDLARTAEKKIIGTLSRGYRQRIGIADSLLSNPSLLIMDEPTIGLDPHQILIIRNLIKELRNQMTIILSSHILPEIETSCDEVIIINQGHIVAQGNNSSLRKEFGLDNIYEISVKADCTALKGLIYNLDPNAHIITEQVEDDFSEISFSSQYPSVFSEALVDRIQNASWKIKKIVYKEPTLEDIFIAATRPSWQVPLYNIRQENILRIAS